MTHVLKAMHATVDAWTTGGARRRFAAFLVAVLAGGLATSPAQAAVAPDSVGVYSEELEGSNIVNDFAVAAAQRSAGVGLVRQSFSWARIETAPGQLDFSVYDDVVASAASAGLAVLPVVMDPPSWRSTAPATGSVRGMYPPRDPADMAWLATALVRRYGPSGSFWAAHPALPPVPIHSWQVWNEPNIPAFWSTGPDPAAYVRLLEAVGSAIRGADPTAEIVAAGLPYAESGMTIGAFIDAMYADGARGTFDTIAIHPYASSPAVVLGILQAVRQQLDRLGDPDRPIWATEFGWATGGPPVTVTTSETSQAKQLRDTIALMAQARDSLHLRGFIAYRWRDVGPNDGQNDVWALHTGLLRQDGSAKPALDAFRAAATGWLGRSADVGQPTNALRPPPGAEPSPNAGRSPGGVPGISRRVLRIWRHISRGHLVVSVNVPPGGGSDRVRISYQALRGNGHVAFQQARRVATRGRVAHVTFTLPTHAGRVVLLRVTASQGGVRATRLLYVHARHTLVRR
jgi:hypothetical protein